MNVSSPVSPAGAAIEFRDVEFNAPNGQTILQKFALAIQQGETLVLLGRSGSGKTTALRLVNRLLEPTMRPRLPAHFPIGTKYVLEAGGPSVGRYIEFPNGRRIRLATRKALSSTSVARQRISIVPDQISAVTDAPALRALLISPPSRQPRPFHAARNVRPTRESSLSNPI